MKFTFFIQRQSHFLIFVRAKTYGKMNKPVILFRMGITSTDNMLAIALVLWISKYTAQYKNYAIKYRQYLTDNREVTVLFQLK